MTSSDNDLLNIFWVEVGEYLETLNASLLQLETTSAVQRPPLLREMNRVAHSMKGAARAVGLTLIETVAHYMEEVFQAARENRIELTPDRCDTLYDALDLIQTVMGGAENDTETLAQVLTRLEQIVVTTELMKAVTADETPEPAPAPAPKPPAKPAKGSPKPSALTPTAPKKTTTQELKPVTPFARTTTLEITPTTSDVSPESQTVVLRPAEDTIRVTVQKLDRLMAEASELLVARMHGEERQRQIADLRRLHARWQREWRSVRAAYIRLVRRVTGDPDSDMAQELNTLFRFLEVNARYLTDANRKIAALTQTVVADNTHLSTLADQFQDDISRMRMVPFDSIVGGFQRMVRDLSRDLGKLVQLEVAASAVELDKAVLESLKDPMMHLLRNGIDHGIESPDERERMGKPPQGTMVLSVEQRGSEITVRVSDDGRGVDPERVRRAAVRAGVLSEADAHIVSDDEARLLIFQPGFTTSDTVTAVSGRGLGMDIVRERVEAMRGRVSLHSVVGVGTTISLSVPVSLTRLRCILLRLGDERYAVPSAMVVRMETVPRSAVFTAEGRDMVLLAGRPTPLAALAALLDVPAEHHDEHTALRVLLLRAADRTIAFEVDDLFSEQELVLKSLGHELARARYVAGAALLGSGDVIIVLDANDLVRGAAGMALPRRRTLAELTPTTRRIRVLVVDDSITTRTLEKNILETAGFEVFVAIDGVEAWRLINENDFDVIITDVEMPRMNGLDLCVRVKNGSQTKDIPVILLTSLSKPEQQEAGLRAGADAYLIKSRFDQGELLSTIQAVL